MRLWCFQVHCQQRRYHLQTQSTLCCNPPSVAASQKHNSIHNTLLLSLFLTMISVSNRTSCPVIHTLLPKSLVSPPHRSQQQSHHSHSTQKPCIPYQPILSLYLHLVTDTGHFDGNTLCGSKFHSVHAVHSVQMYQGCMLHPALCGKVRGWWLLKTQS